MYEFHGWAKIVEAPCEIEDVEQLPKIIEAIESQIKKIISNQIVKSLNKVNGFYFINFSGCTNHELVEEYNPVNFFKFLASVSPGSYGILYILNDEDRNGLINDFRVYVLKRGKLIEQDDPFLSPFIPTVEDES